MEVMVWRICEHISLQQHVLILIDGIWLSNSLNFPKDCEIPTDGNIG